MSVIVGYTVPAAAFEFGQTLRGCEFARIELDRLASVGGDDTPVRYFWIHEGDPTTFQAVLEASPLVERVDVLDELAEAFLCRVHPSEEWHGFGELVHDQDAVILEASGTPERWHGRLRFHSQEGATAFQQACYDRGVSLTITKVHDLRAPTSQGALGEVVLTPVQQEGLALALDRGYFDIPRRATLVDLGDYLGVSDQALSERLRRAQSSLARAVVERKPPEYIQ